MSERKKITPRARRFAASRGIALDSLSDVPGSGFDGGITESDLLARMEGRGPGASGEAAGARAPVRATPLARAVADAEGVSLASIAGAASGVKLTKADVLKAAGDAKTAPVAEGAKTAAIPEAERGGKRVATATPYAGVRKIIGERLAQSKFTAPHLYFTQKIDLGDLLSLRATVNGSQERKTSVTDYVAKAVVIALLRYPGVNASLAGDVIEQYENVNLGIAVASPSGLIVPVVRDAERMSLVELSRASAALVEKARESKLVPEEYHGGTFTISNLGMFGIENFTAIINPPESGILAVSATKDEAVVVKDADGGKSIEIRPLMNITLTVDHRLIDGLLAARFIGEVKRLLESPVELLL
jgi:pyruvate dehydrogenase E2 component (dihydrolipoamide acetyltransferase)